MQKTARPAGIYHEIGDKLDRFALSLASERNTRVLLSRVDQRDLIPIFHTQRLRLLHKIMIEVSTVPVSVRNFFAWTSPDQQLALPFWIRSEQLTRFVMVKREPAFHPASDLRCCPLPGSPFGERTNPG